MKAKINNGKVINCSICQNKKISGTVNNSNAFCADVANSENINANSTQRGPQGIPGEAATIQLGTVSTGAAGSDVIITNSGTENAAIFNFTIPRGDRGEQGEQGIQGETGNGIVSIELTSTSGLVDTYTITFTDGNTTTFNVTNGKDGIDGQDGNGIASIQKTSTSGLVDTYTITFDNGNTETFTVTNGQKGDTGAAATISVGSTTTGAAGTSASVTNSGTSSAAVLDFVIPQGVQGETGATGADGFSPTATVTKSGDTATITITDKNGTTTATVSDGSGASSISQLTDVDLTGLSDGDVLVYDSTSQEWKAEAQSGTVTDVEVNGESVVTGGVAEIDLSGYVKSSELPTIGDGTIIIKEGTTEKGRFTLNQTGDTTVNLTQVGAGMITFMQDGKQSGRVSANRATDMTITLKGLYDYESVNADMIGNNLEQANNNRVTGFSTNDYIVMREPITLPQYWEYDVDFSLSDTAEGIGDEQYIFSDVNNTFALKENEDDQLYESFTLYVNGSPAPSNIEAESAYYNIKFIKGMDENYNIVGSGNTLQCYVYVGYSSGQSAQKELVGSFTSSTAPTTVQTIFGTNSNHAKPLSDDSYIDFTKCFIDGITRSGNTVTKTRIWDGLVKTIDTKVNTWDLASDLNGKADTDLSNITDTAKIAIANASMPSNTYEALTWGATGTTYTAPADGWFYAQARFTGAIGVHYIFLSTSGTGMSIRSGIYNANTTTVMTDQINLPVRKGATVSLNYGSASGQTMDNNYIRFCYAQGSTSEA